VTGEYLAQDLLDLGGGCFLVRMAILHRLAYSSVAQVSLNMENVIDPAR
jgi:hypothetical protein